jgi:hypothetical protein
MRQHWKSGPRFSHRVPSDSSRANSDSTAPQNATPGVAIRPNQTVPQNRRSSMPNEFIFGNDRHEKLRLVVMSDESCVDGVEYIQFPTGVSVKYNNSDGRGGAGSSGANAI